MYTKARVISQLSVFNNQYMEKDRKKNIENKFNHHCHNLYKKDLFSHFGCVNAIAFSKDGEYLVSGIIKGPSKIRSADRGDDKRVLLWNCNEITHIRKPTPVCMKTNHLSNILSVTIDPDTQHILSTGNDEKVFYHNISRGTCENVYIFDEPVYCVDMPSDDSCIFITGGEDGSIQLCDVRAPNTRKRIAFSAGSFHSVAFHPIEQRIIASANSMAGAALWDTRYPGKVLLSYNKRSNGGQPVNAMSVQFNYTGCHLLVLRRKGGPVLYKVDDTSEVVEFEHEQYGNICTMKTACFAGEKEQYIVSGSDDFNLYIWNISKQTDDELKKDPHLILQGHRSIVNQVRYNRHQNILASSGVEKIIKVWSSLPMNDCSGDTTGDEHFIQRNRYSHEDYMRLLYQGGEMTHDYEDQNTEEDSRMLAFFDSLLERTKSNLETDSSSDEENDNSRAMRILRILLDRNNQDSQLEHSSSSNSSDNENEVSNENEAANENEATTVSESNTESNRAFGVSLDELRRIFRCDSRETDNTNTYNTTPSDLNSESDRENTLSSHSTSLDLLNSHPPLLDNNITINHSDIEGQTSQESQGEEEEEESSTDNIRRIGRSFKNRIYRNQQR